MGKKNVLVAIFISLLIFSSFVSAEIDVAKPQVKISLWQKVIDFFSGETPQDSPSPQPAQPVILVYKCQTLDKTGGYYLLKNDIKTTGTCFEIKANSITFDLNNHSISGNYNSSAFGVFVRYQHSALVKNGLIEKFDSGVRIDHANNNMIKNMILIRNSAGASIWEGKNNTINSNLIKENLAAGVYTSYASENKIINNSFKENTFAVQTVLTQISNIDGNYMDHNNVGINLAKSDNNSIINNTIVYSKVKYGGIHIESANNNIIQGNNIGFNEVGITLNYSRNIILGNYIINNTQAGISFEDPDFGGNLIYNNYLRNKVNVYYNLTEVHNFWNVTKKPGKNIVGGAFLAGNYWANLNGTGLSETCADVDNDGICEAQRKINDDNIDYLPLTI